MSEAGKDAIRALTLAFVLVTYVVAVVAMCVALQNGAKLDKIQAKLFPAPHCLTVHHVKYCKESK